MQFVRRTSMVPFLSLEKGDLWLARITGRQEVLIRGEKRDCVNLDIYWTGKTADGLPNEKAVAEYLGKKPTPALVGASKAIQEGCYLDADGKAVEPKGKAFLIGFNGKKAVGGGKSFNQWDIYEVTGI